MPSWEFSMDPQVERAWTIPSAFYTDPDAYQVAKEKIFANSWQFVTWAENVKVPGSTYPFTLLEGCLDEPLLFTRDRNDTLHCLSNVCTHRGNIVCEGTGTENSLRCRYHGRRFGLDGQCQFMPEFEDVEGYPAPSDNLQKVEFATWRQFLFTCVGKSQATLQQVFQEIEDRIGWLPIQEFVHSPERGREYLVNGHWALYVDNYLEGFHIPYIHAALNEKLNYGDYCTELITHGNLQLGVASDADVAFDIPQTSPDHGKRIAAYYYWLFPNLMLNFYPWGLSVNVVRPLGPSRTKVSFIPFVWKEENLGSGAGGDLDRVEREDEAVVELVQKGLRSRFYDRGRYSPKRENGVHQFHTMIAESMAGS